MALLAELCNSFICKKYFFMFRPGPRPKNPRFQIRFLERLGLVEISSKKEQEINLGYADDEKRTHKS